MTRKDPDEGTTTSFERLRRDIRAVDPSGKALVEIAADPASPIRRFAVHLLGEFHHPDAIGLLSSLVDTPISDSTPEHFRELWAEAAHTLSLYDAPASAVRLAKARAQMAKTPHLFWPTVPRGVASAIDDYLWRMGLSEEVNLCPARMQLILGPTKGPIGTAHPTVVYAADPALRWAVVCQAREDTDGNGKIEVSVGHHGDLLGDDMAPYLVIGGGSGQRIDDYVASAPKGRFLVIVRGVCLSLVDVEKRTEVALHKADGRVGDSSFGPPRAAAFSGDGQRMLYIRSNGGQESIVVRDLETGRESSIDPGPGLLYRARFDTRGQNVVMSVVVSDTDGNGRLEWPSTPTMLVGRKCRGPVTSFGTYGQEGDVPITRIAPVRGGPAIDATLEEQTESAPRPPAIINAAGRDAWRGPISGPVLFRR